MTQTADETSELTTHYPPRFRWLRRMILGFLLLLVVLFVIRAVVVHRAQSALDEVIAELRARGQPVSLADLQRPDIPASENAAILLRRAATSIVTSAEHDRALRAFVNDKFDSHDLESINDWVRVNAPSLALVRQARSVPQANWSRLLPNPVDDARHNASQHRVLENMLRRAAEQTAREGDVIAFTEYCIDELTIQRVIQEAPLLESQYEASFARRAACIAIENDGLALVPALHAPAARDAVQKLSALLLDEEPLRQFMTRLTAQVRLARIYDAQLADKNPREMWYPRNPDWQTRAWYRSMLYLFRAPILSADRETLLNLNGIDSAILQPTFWQGERAAALTPMRQVGVDFVNRLIRDDKSPGDALLLYYRDLAYRRMAAISLAIRLYQADHDGKFPSTLNELVPTYMSCLPEDPFAKNGDPLRMTGSAPLRLYTVDVYQSDGTRRNDLTLTLDHTLAPPPVASPATSPSEN